MIEQLGRSVIIRGATAVCAGVLATTLAGCGEKPDMPLPSCYNTVQFDDSSLVAADGPPSDGETSESPEPDTETTSPPDTEPDDTPEEKTNWPNIPSTVSETLGKASLRVLYKSGTSDARQSSGFFAINGSTIYAFTAAHLFEDNTDLAKAVIITQDGYTMQPTRGCFMAENDGERISPEDINGSDIDVAVLEVHIPEADKYHIAPLPLATTPLEEGSWVAIRAFNDHYPFAAKTANSDGTRLQAGIPSDGLYHRNEYSIDPGDSGSLVASVTHDNIAVQGIVTSASDYSKHPNKPQSVRMTPAKALQRAIDGLKNS